MRAVIGLLLLFTGAEVLYLVVTGRLGSSSASTSTSSTPTSTTMPTSGTGTTFLTAPQPTGGGVIPV